MHLYGIAIAIYCCKVERTKLKILCSNARGIKLKKNSWEEVVYSTKCNLYPVTESNLKQNEHVVVNK